MYLFQTFSPSQRQGKGGAGDTLDHRSGLVGNSKFKT